MSFATDRCARDRWVVGDAVMALFGAPIQREDDAEQAVRTALELCASMREITAEITSRRDVSLAFGVGIHTGMVVAGNMGSPSRLNYTVIGDGVSLASRLEGLTKYYGVGAIVSEATRDACPEIVCRELDLVRVKGRKAPLAIFEPIGFKDRVDQKVVLELSRYHEGIQRFRAAAWSDALEIFDELACCAGASPMPRLYLNRIRQMQKHPPGPGWDGVATFDQK
ncbi:MAG: adenylate/guanylate cyclase domain-containing protein [Pseudomonadales bacterium]